MQEGGPRRRGQRPQQLRRAAGDRQVQARAVDDPPRHGGGLPLPPHDDRTPVGAERHPDAVVLIDRPVQRAGTTGSEVVHRVPRRAARGDVRPAAPVVAELDVHHPVRASDDALAPARGRPTRRHWELGPGRRRVGRHPRRSSAARPVLPRSVRSGTAGTTGAAATTAATGTAGGGDVETDEGALLRALGVRDGPRGMRPGVHRGHVVRATGCEERRPRLGVRTRHLQGDVVPGRDRQAQAEGAGAVGARRGREGDARRADHRVRRAGPRQDQHGPVGRHQATTGDRAVPHPQPAEGPRHRHQRGRRTGHLQRRTGRRTAVERRHPVQRSDGDRAPARGRRTGRHRRRHDARQGHDQHRRDEGGQQREGASAHAAGP